MIREQIAGMVKKLEVLRLWKYQIDQCCTFLSKHTGLLGVLFPCYYCAKKRAQL